MASGYTVIQKGRTRYTFIAGSYYMEIGGMGGKRIPTSPRYSIHTEQLLTTGGSLTMRDVTKEEGNKFYLDCLAKGFHQFRNAREVSWYATIENNSPYEEEWTIEGKYLVPIKSRSISDEE